MNQILKKLYTFSYRFIQIFAVLLSGLWFFCAFFFTCYADNMETQKVLTKWDNPIFSLFGIFCLFFCFFLLSKFFSQYCPKGKQILLCVVLGWVFLAGMLLIVFSKTVPAADSMSVYSIAESLANNNTSVIHPTDSYLSYYPQQIGLVSFYEIIFRFWNLLNTEMPAYHMIKCMNVIFALLIVIFQYHTVHLLWKNDQTDCFYLLLIGTHFPFLMYTSFVYGEIPSFAAVSAGIYYVLKLLYLPETSSKKTKITLFLCSLFALTASVLFRKNSLILIIAVLIVTLLEFLKNRRKELLLFIIVCVICSCAILPCIQKFYELRAGNTLKTGVPAISYFAMGMQEASRGNGWYNGFNFSTYQETGMDTQKTTEVSKAAIKERLTYFQNHPDYAVNFYFYKYLSQWADGTYASRQATLATFGGRNAFFDSVYSGSYSKYLISYCNTWQNLLYLGVFFFCLKNFQRKTSSLLPVYLCFIGVIGGFLFHMLWEANSRYIFLYGLLLIPYASRGLSLICTQLAPLKHLTTSKDF